MQCMATSIFKITGHDERCVRTAVRFFENAYVKNRIVAAFCEQCASAMINAANAAKIPLRELEEDEALVHQVMER